MEVLHVFDAGHYDAALPRITRSAVRAIILRGGLLTLIKSDRYGDYKFPGGGVEPGESHLDALRREVREETGRALVPASVKPYGIIVELRRDKHAQKVFEQRSYYYLCETEGAVSDTDLDDYERAYGYKEAVVSADTAIAANAPLTHNENIPWVRRELFALRHIKEHIK